MSTPGVRSEPRRAGDAPPGASPGGSPSATSTRQRIIQCAARLFAAEGYDRTPVTAIEKAAGLSPGAGGLYRHFSSKYAILEAVVDQAIAESRAATTPVGPPPADLGEAAEVLARGAVEQLAAEMPLLAIILRDLPQFPELMARAEREWFRRGQQLVVDWLRHYQAEGGLRSDLDLEATAVAIMGMLLYQPMMTWVTGVEPLGVSRERIVAAVRLLLGQLAAR